MEENKEVVKHVLLAKFKDGIPTDEIDQLIRSYARLLDHIDHMKSFTWGKDINIGKFQQGFTHIFESSFDSTDGLAEYVAHPTLADFGNLLIPQLEKFLIIDYKPTK